MPADMPLLERILLRLTITDGCWEWTGASDATGAGQIRAGAGDANRLYYVSHLMYEAAYGPIPDGLLVLHHCDNRPCNRPSHLFVGTHADNTHDMLNKGRHTLGGKKGRLNAPKIMDIRALGASGNYTHKEIAAMYGLARSYVTKIIAHQNWKHLP